VICNKEIKFGLLLEKALQIGSDFIATGHYAKVIKRKNKFHLYKAKDKTKDQSYFLWQLNQKQLKHIIFPLGNLTKTEVKKLAKKYQLPVSGIPESQEICFIKNTLEEFLQKYLKPKPGKIIDVNGKVLGTHKGLVFYTIGQRKGIRLSGGPYYVVDKDIKNNLLIVTKAEIDLYKKELVAENINWVLGSSPDFPLRIKAKIRYLHTPASATVYPLNPCKVRPCKKIRVVFDRPQKAITPGQSVVFYKGQEVLGGGIIEKTINSKL